MYIILQREGVRKRRREGEREKLQTESGEGWKREQELGFQICPEPLVLFTEISWPWLKAEGRPSLTAVNVTAGSV